MGGTPLGVSGAVALARLSFLLPDTLIGAEVLLIVAPWWAYRPVTACTDGTCNAVSRRPLRVVVWAATVRVMRLATIGLISR